MSALKKHWVVEVVEVANKKVVTRIDCHTDSRSHAERVQRGVNINLNHAKFFTRLVSE